ncbi:hypothetical protein Tsubulata_004630 [Turnera subulata]|uniref:Pectinesterase inhibitor domain-containing protein n=1 Tax=Turnera subulata TaxID=218843 RepID=A0A9Q0GBT9_9ROSI|nr:hypothetical protein Tsubulata_004630 [Turnera subulata]
MISKQFFSTILNFFIIFLLFYSCEGVNNLQVHGYCKEAAHSDPNLSYAFCVASLEANPRSKKADLEELLNITLHLTISNATNIASSIKQLLDGKNFDPYTRGALKDCLELYLDADSSLHDAICDFKSKDYFKANLDASAAMDSAITCEDDFKEKKGVVSPLTRENDTFFQLTAMVLAFLKMLSS